VEDASVDVLLPLERSFRNRVELVQDGDVAIGAVAEVDRQKRHTRRRRLVGEPAEFRDGAQAGA